MFRILLAILAALPGAIAQTRPQPPKSVRLYVFDNGVIKGIDPARFDFKKEDLATTEMVCASYLIVHPKGTLMWDTGAIPDSALKPDASPVTQGLFTATKTLKSQLAAAGYSAKDITYIGLSHYHGDHIANANDLPARRGWCSSPSATPCSPRSRRTSRNSRNTRH